MGRQPGLSLVRAGLPQKPNSLMKCPCGKTFDIHRLEHTLIHVPHITAARRTDEIRR